MKCVCLSIPTFAKQIPGSVANTWSSFSSNTLLCLETKHRGVSSGLLNSSRSDALLIGLPMEGGFVTNGRKICYLYVMFGNISKIYFKLETSIHDHVQCRYLYLFGVTFNFHFCNFRVHIVESISIFSSSSFSDINNLFRFKIFYILRKGLLLLLACQPENSLNILLNEYFNKAFDIWGKTYQFV